MLSNIHRGRVGSLNFQYRGEKGEEEKEFTVESMFYEVNIVINCVS